MSETEQKTYPTKAELYKMTNSALKELAAKEGIQVEGDANKDTLVNTINDVFSELRLTGNDASTATSADTNASTVAGVDGADTASEGNAGNATAGEPQTVTLTVEELNALKSEIATDVHAGLVEQFTINNKEMLDKASSIIERIEKLEKRLSNAAIAAAPVKAEGTQVGSIDDLKAPY